MKGGASEPWSKVSSMQGVRIRWATPTDVPGILDCLRVAFEPFRKEYTPRAYIATVLTRSMAVRRLRSMTVFVAVTRNHQIVGTVAIKRVSSSDAHLRGMAVVPRYQGQGVASHCSPPRFAMPGNQASRT